MLKFPICVLSSLIATMTADFVKVDRCASGAPSPISVDLSDCSLLPCRMVTGTTFVWSMVFKADDYHAEVQTSFIGTYRSITMGYPGIDKVMSCDSIYSVPDNVKVGCPLEKGKTYKHVTTTDLHIKSPKMTFNTTYGLIDPSTKNYIVCFQVQVDLIPPST